MFEIRERTTVIVDGREVVLLPGRITDTEATLYGLSNAMSPDASDSEASGEPTTKPTKTTRKRA